MHVDMIQHPGELFTNMSSQILYALKVRDLATDAVWVESIHSPLYAIVHLWSDTLCHICDKTLPRLLAHELHPQYTAPFSPSLRRTSSVL